MKKKIFNILIEVLCMPTIFFANKTRKQLYRANVIRFLSSLGKERKTVYKEFIEFLNRQPYTANEKKLAFIQFLLLYHLTGMEIEDFQTCGGLRYSSFSTKMFVCVSRWRQNVFQFSVNKNYNNEKNRKVLDNKVEFNRLFQDFIGRDYIISSEPEQKVCEFIRNHRRVIIKPLAGSSGKGIFDVNYQQFETMGRLSEN